MAAPLPRRPPSARGGTGSGRRRGDGGGSGALSPFNLWPASSRRRAPSRRSREQCTPAAQGAKEHAAGALRNLSYNDDTAVAVAEAGAIATARRAAARRSRGRPLWNLSDNDDSGGSRGGGRHAPLIRATERTWPRRGAAEPSDNDDTAAAIAAAGGIAPLIELLRSGSGDAGGRGGGAAEPGQQRRQRGGDRGGRRDRAARAVAGATPQWLDGDAVEALERVRAAVEAQAAAQQERQAAAARVAAAEDSAARSERWKAERVQAGVDEHMPERPTATSAPITHEAMIDPVIDALGNTYERSAIQRWLRSHNTSPLTGATLPHKRLTPNNVLRSIIQEWEEEKHKECAAMAQAPGAAQAG